MTGLSTWCARLPKSAQTSPRRAEAMARLASLGESLGDAEDWKYTHAQGWLRADMGIAESPANNRANEHRCAPDTLLPDGLSRDFFDGVVVSENGYLPQSTQTLSETDESAFFSAQQALPVEIEAQKLDAFQAFNLASNERLIQVHTDQSQQSLLLLHRHQVEQPSLTQPSVVVVVRPGAQLCLTEFFQSTGAYCLQNALTRIWLGEGSTLHYYRIIDNAEQTKHCGAVFVHQQSHSTSHLWSAPLTGNGSRCMLRVKLAGENASNRIEALSVAQSRQWLDHRVRVEHEQPHTQSRIGMRALAQKLGVIVQDVETLVCTDTPDTESHQSLRALLLNPLARIYAIPRLRIHNNDVVCSHGVSMGMIHEQALAYMRSRGIGLSQAKAMLARAFAQDVLADIPHDGIRALLQQRCMARVDQICFES